MGADRQRLAAALLALDRRELCIFAAGALIGTAEYGPLARLLETPRDET
jgi:hypothetical protein